MYCVSLGARIFLFFIYMGLNTFPHEDTSPETEDNESSEPKIDAGSNNTQGVEDSELKALLTDPEVKKLYDLYRTLDDAALETILYSMPGPSDRMVFLATAVLAERRESQGKYRPDDGHY